MPSAGKSMQTVFKILSYSNDSQLLEALPNIFLLYHKQNKVTVYI